MGRATTESQHLVVVTIALGAIRELENLNIPTGVGNFLPRRPAIATVFDVDERGIERR